MFTSKPTKSIPIVPTKSLLIYDADCSFCRRWITRLRYWLGEKIDYLPLQEAEEFYAEIPLTEMKRAVQLIETDGTVYSGAHAIFKVLALISGARGILIPYYYLPGYAWISETGYEIVSRNRPFFDKLMTLTFGRSNEPAEYFFSRWIFLRGLALIYLIAFISLWVQMEGLIGENGILPVSDYLNMAGSRLGWERFYYLPTLFWLDSSNLTLNLACGAGVLFSGVLFFNVAPLLCLFFLWTLYLSFLIAGQDFLRFQWDILLLEAGFLAIFFAPYQLLPSLRNQHKPSRLVLFLFWWLLFRLMFSSGWVKLASGDETWWTLSALKYHYETQPIPNWIAWYSHQLPGWLHSTSASFMFLIELVLPFLIFTPRRPRLLAFSGFVFLQLLIILTGNYGFFNYLTIVLCLLLIDDVYWKKITLSGFSQRLNAVQQRAPEPKLKKALTLLVLVILLFISSIQMNHTLLRGWGIPSVFHSMARLVSPFHLVNTYGLFAVMTITRPEIILEGSLDGKTWKAYEFKWKPGNLRQPPRFVAPHQPRLDWQMWFAALGHYQQNPWLLNFMERLMQGTPEVLALLKENPFPSQPPRYMRALLYDYRFSTWGSPEAQQGQWWVRQRPGLYTPVLTLKQPEVTEISSEQE
jgi:predicted DCC family thiol-disulfide oxidoreductase YuxK